MRNWVKAAICFQGKSQGKIEFNLQVKVKYSFWIAGSGQKGHIKVSVLPSGNFLGICSFFFGTQHGVRGSVVLCVTELAFSKKYIFAVKIVFFKKMIGKFSHYFFLNSACSKSLYYLLYSCANLIFGRNLVPDLYRSKCS